MHIVQYLLDNKASVNARCSVTSRFCADNSFEALLLQCTHQANQLTPNGNGYTCSLHGSQFDKNGNVTKGPAERTLKHYPVSVGQDKLSIQLKS